MILHHSLQGFKSSYGLLLRSIFVSAMCVALNFINDFGAQFQLYSPLKHDGYLVNGSEFKLRFIVDRPKLHSYVKFSAKDPSGESSLFLNGEPSISERVVAGCPNFRRISVKPQQGDFSASEMKEVNFKLDFPRAYLLIMTLPASL